MRVNLSKEDLIKLVLTTSPSYKIIDDELLRKYGSYTGGFVDKWHWDTKSLSNLSEEHLYGMYLLCKDSWQ